MPRILDHIDLRVRSLAECQPFYEVLLPALGFTRDSGIPGWFQYESAEAQISSFFGVVESPAHIANESRIAFWAESIADVDRLAALLAPAGARNIEGPALEEAGYYAVFFQDPSGNRLEICHRFVEHEKAP